jgi:hypothetical protein
MGMPQGMAPAACAYRIPHRLTRCSLVAAVGRVGLAKRFLARTRWRCAPIVVYIVYIGQIAEMQRRWRAPCRITTRSEQRTEPWWIAS